MSDDANQLDAYYAGARDRIHAAGLFGKANARMHRSLERHRDHAFYPQTVELGAGGMQHIQHVRHRYDRYCAIDIREFTPIAQEFATAVSPRDTHVDYLVADASDLPLPDSSVDRIVASCLIMHLADPHAAILEWLRVLRPAGVLDFLVPCDPGLLLRFFRWLINEPTARRHGISRKQYRLLNAVDHISSFERIHRLVSVAAGDYPLIVRYRPFRLPSWNLNGYAVFSIESPQ